MELNGLRELAGALAKLRRTTDWEDVVISFECCLNDRPRIHVRETAFRALVNRQDDDAVSGDGLEISIDALDVSTHGSRGRHTVFLCRACREAPGPVQKAPTPTAVAEVSAADQAWLKALDVRW